MKNTTLLLSLVAGAAFAGEPGPAPTVSAPATTLGEWFVGGTFTNLEGDADVYALQIGRDLGTQFLGFETAAYLETGMYDNHSAPELEYNPFTANLKLERPLVGPLNLYITGGLGFATWESAADDGTSFYAQTSAGVLYNVCECLEVFVGGRLAYPEEASDEEIGWEVGGRINF